MPALFTRREFAFLLTAAAARLPFAHAASAVTGPSVFDQFPARPAARPLDWRKRAADFDSYVLDPANHVLRTRDDGTTFFASALEGTGDGGLTTFAPIVLGKLLRGDDVSHLMPSMASYYSEEASIFLDGTHAELCEYWYLMNVNAMAFAIIRRHRADDPVWRDRVKNSAERLIAVAQQIKYDFNDQGYVFTKKAPFTHQDIYRQPDTIGGYAYVLLLAHGILGDPRYLDEARSAMQRYLAFSANPWYEIPSGAMATAAAARLDFLGHKVDVERAVSFALDPSIHCLHTGKWGNAEVNGLMAGFRTEPPGEAYSMESLVALPYLLPMVRLQPQFANLVGRYALHVAANMQLFYSDCIPRANQSQPGLTAAVPYERLTREVNGHSPFSSGDYGSHRSIYGGAYALWWGELVQPAGDDFLLRLDLSRSDFLAAHPPPAWLYYNPYPTKKRVTLALGQERVDVWDLAAQQLLGRGHAGNFELTIGGGESRVIALLPPGTEKKSLASVIAG